MSGGLSGAAITTAEPPFESWTAAPQAMRDWCATAQAGERMVYARVWLLPKHSAAASHARKLAADRFVMLLPQRRLAGGLVEYAMQRLRVQRASIGQPLKPKGPELSGDMSRVLRLLRECARLARPCPSNREIEKKSGVKNASYVIQKLADAGVIRSAIVNAATGARVITIIATGAITADPRS